MRLPTPPSVPAVLSVAFLFATSLAAAPVTGVWRMDQPRGGGVLLRTYFVLNVQAGQLSGKVVINDAVDLALLRPHFDQGDAVFSTAWNTDYRLHRQGDRLEVTVTYVGHGSEHRVAVAAPMAEALPPRTRPVPPLTPLPANHLAASPPMGWNSWNHFGDRVSDRIVREAADALVRTGLAKAGYVYVNIDDCWEGGRDAAGRIQPNGKFPDLKALADYVHGLGLKLGLYSSPGPRTCGGYEGSYGYEDLDAKTYAAWGIDYLKYDWCSAARVYSDAFLQGVYQQMGRALLASGRPMVYSLCEYGTGAVWKWGPAVAANLWRTTGDIQDNWRSMSEIGFRQSELAPYAAPGHWNDPDMLEVGNGGMTDAEYRTHFSLWCLLAAPLMAGNDLTTMSPETLAILGNREAIALDQDSLGRQGTRLKARAGVEVWTKPLQGGAIGVGLFNRNDAPSPGAVGWAELGLSSAPAEVRDLWEHRDVTPGAARFSAMIPGHSVVLLRLKP